MEPISIYWWTRPFEWIRRSGPNCGDAMCPIIVRVLSGKLPVLKKYGGERFVTIGSVLHYVRPGDVLWGTGALDGTPYNGPRDIRICAVRGPRTAAVLRESGIHVPSVFGDPGALIAPMLGFESTCEFDVGIVPHFKDFTRAVELFRPAGAMVIDITSGVKKVCEQISRCARIFSSSLHGLVIADSLGIDSRYVRFTSISDKALRMQGRNDFKFDDYYEGSGRAAVRALDWSRGVSKEEMLGCLSTPRTIFHAETLLRACPFNFRQIYTLEDLRAAYREDPFLDECSR